MDCSRAKTKDPDEWLENAPPFSQPLALQLREWFLRWEPDLTESIKWNILCFSARKLVCGISACKAHVGIAFFRGIELPDDAGVFTGGEMNTLIRNIRLTSLDTLNVEALRSLLAAAVRLDASELPPPPPNKRAPLPVPPFFAAALRKDRKAGAGFAGLSPSCQREWIVWLSSAKREETRDRRLAEALVALAHGRKWIERKTGAAR